jgi:adenosylcobinamide-GDP ribazoletransferase
MGRTVKGLNGLRSALGLLTIAGRGAAPTPWALPWFSAVGAVIGLLVGLTLQLESRSGLVLAATLAIAVDLIATGCLHLDGLADSADGLLPHATRERRFTIMKTPDIGAFGLGVTVVVLALRWSVFVTAIQPNAAIAWTVAAIWAWSRALMALALLTATPARPGGLSAAFQPTGRRGLLTAATMGASVAVIAGCWWSATRLTVTSDGPGEATVGWAFGQPTLLMLAVGVTATWLGSSGVLLVAKRRLGGYTGDVLGAMGVVGETVGLVAMVMVKR